jgi:hypothetical protein
MYYHGSESKYQALTPKPSNLLGGEQAVYATQEFALAALFIARELTCRDISIGTYEYTPLVDTLHITEERAGALQELHGISGWVHAVRPTHSIRIVDWVCNVTSSYTRSRWWWSMWYIYPMYTSVCLHTTLGYPSDGMECIGVRWVIVFYSLMIYGITRGRLYRCIITQNGSPHWWYSAPAAELPSGCEQHLLRAQLSGYL